MSLKDLTLSQVTLSQVKARQPEWFSPSNKRIFGDCRYTVRYGKRTGERYLVRSTYIWSYMFRRPKTLCYRINRLADDLEVLELVDTIFNDKTKVTRWLRKN